MWWWCDAVVGIFFACLCVVVQKRIFFRVWLCGRSALSGLWWCATMGRRKSSGNNDDDNGLFVGGDGGVGEWRRGEMYVCGVVGSDDDGSHSTVLFVGYFCGKRRAQNSLKAKKCVGLTENHEKWRCITMIAPTHIIRCDWNAWRRWSDMSQHAPNQHTHTGHTSWSKKYHSKSTTTKCIIRQQGQWKKKNRLVMTIQE